MDNIDKRTERYLKTSKENRSSRMYSTYGYLKNDPIMCKYKPSMKAECNRDAGEPYGYRIPNDDKTEIEIVVEVIVNSAVMVLISSLLLTAAYSVKFMLEM